MAFIEIDGLSKSFGGVSAVRNVSLAIQEQEFITLLGPSGCGKTTTLRLIAGFLEPDEGSIIVNGQTLSQARRIVPPEERRMGMVFQNYAVWPHMSIFDNVAFGLKLARQPRREIAERVDRVLATVGLEGFEERHPAELSGGQQQRVALARSLVLEPSILLLDEPLSNLDAKLRERMRTELKELQRRTAITFVYVTHDQAEAMALSDRIAVFNQGRLQQFGAPREIYGHPANLFVADFMGQVNILPGEIIERTADDVLVRVGQRTIRARVGGAEGDGIERGSRVSVTIRPEAIELGTRDDDRQVNRFRGTIHDTMFLGNLVEHLIDIGGAVLWAQSHPSHDFPIGSPIDITIPVKSCSAMAGDA